MITLVVHYRVAPNAVDSVMRCLRELRTASRAEPGCFRYEVAQVVDEPDRFMLFEQYVDEAALEAHGASEHFRRLVLGDLSALLEERVRERYRAD